MAINLSKTTEHVIQVALFISGSRIRSDELSLKVRMGLDIGEFEPMIIPDAPGMPDEIPRLNIATPAGYRFSASKSRIDFILDLALGLDEEKFNQYRRNVEALAGIVEGAGARIHRIGLVRTLFFRSEAPQDIIQQGFLKKNVSGLKEANVNIVRDISISGIKGNDLYNIGCGFIIGQQRGISINRDINTDPNIALSWGRDDVMRFYDEAMVISNKESLSNILEV